MVSIIALITLVATAAALKVTYPTESDVWKTGESQTITWDTVSTDPSVVDVYLSNMASYPTTSILLASDVSASDGKLTIDGSKLAVGTAFTINLSNGSTQIYAQSNQFNITEGSTSSSSDSDTSSSTTTTSSSSPGTPTTSSSSSSSSSPSESTAAVSTTTPSSSSPTTTARANISTVSSAASATGTATGTAGATSTATGTGAASTSTTTSGAGKIMAGWAGFVALAAMAL